MNEVSVPNLAEAIEVTTVAGNMNPPSQPVAAQIREYRAKHPNAKPIEIARALGIKLDYVYSRLSIEAKKKLAAKKRGRPPKKEVTPPIRPAGSVVFVPLTPTASETAVQQHPLYEVFTKAIKQAMYGKGERHGGAATPFMEQPWAHYAKLHGRGFLTGQAAKKLEEAASTREGTAFEDEMLGAMVYIGMAVLTSRSGK